MELKDSMKIFSALGIVAIFVLTILIFTKVNSNKSGKYSLKSRNISTRPPSPAERQKEADLMNKYNMGPFCPQGTITQSSPQVDCVFNCLSDDYINDFLNKVDDDPNVVEEWCCGNPKWQTLNPAPPDSLRTYPCQKNSECQTTTVTEQTKLCLNKQCVDVNKDGTNCPDGTFEASWFAPLCPPPNQFTKCVPLDKQYCLNCDNDPDYTCSK